MAEKPDKVDESDKPAEKAPKTNMDRLTAWTGRSVLVMTVAADRYGVAGVLKNMDDWGIELRTDGSSNSSFIPWAAVIQIDRTN